MCRFLKGPRTGKVLDKTEVSRNAERWWAETGEHPAESGGVHKLVMAKSRAVLESSNGAL